MSLMNSRKRVSPRTEPCRTAELTKVVVEWVPLTTENCLLLKLSLLFLNKRKEIFESIINWVQFWRKAYTIFFTPFHCCQLFSIKTHSVSVLVTFLKKVLVTFIYHIHLLICFVISMISRTSLNTISSPCIVYHLLLLL